MEEALLRWGIRDFTPIEIDIPGSPRRSMERHAVRQGNGIYILEKLPLGKKAVKEAAAGILESLHCSGLPVEYFLRSNSGTFTERCGSSLWVLKEYIPGEKLARPDFIEDAWRGREAARFILSLKKASENIHADAPHLPYFIERQIESMKRREPGTYRKVKGAYEEIKPFLNAWRSLPQAFAHGDFHPMNIIWGEERINAVIDWEFMGDRPELYDAAMMLGCMGIEDPDGLFLPFADEFLTTLKKGPFKPISWRYLPELIIATRFAWLDEWVRNKDEEMIEMETEYIIALSTNLEGIHNFLIDR